MAQVSIQSGKERHSFIHESHSRVTPAMNAPLMAFGGFEKPFKIEVVYRQLDGIAADKQPRSEGAHSLRHLLARRVGIAIEPSCQSEE